MIRCEVARVEQMRDAWPGVTRAWVRSEADGARLSALAYTAIVGELNVGDVVRVNTNAVRRGLGTGGDAFVVARTPGAPVRDDADAADAPRGHMVKARYTPQQMLVDALDDPESPHHGTIDAARSLDHLPVVVADLHSSLGSIAAGVLAERPGARIVYVHTDGAALPAAYSRQNAALRDAGILAATISTGQSFGGDAEAVSTPSALMAARHVYGADVTIVSQGPGNLGTGTTWGFSGVQVADVLNQVGALGGVPIAALRVSEADQRARHRGLSHHSATVLDTLTYPSVLLPVPDADLTEVDAEVREALTCLNARRAESGRMPHTLQPTPSGGLLEAIEGLPGTVSTMGRGLGEDPAAFLYAALAGRAAARYAGHSGA